MATKEARRQARDVIEGLECRVHAGPPVRVAEIHAANEFLRNHEFPAASDYFDRLARIRDRLEARATEPASTAGKRNYGGEISGHWMQVQSAYDHVILSTCHAGEFNGKRGRIKISHRFNHAGRIEFVELKFLSSLQPALNGQLRKLLMVRREPDDRKDWQAAEAFVLEILPRELVFLFAEIFRTPRSEMLAWLINIGHGLAEMLSEGLRKINGHALAPASEPNGQLSLSAVRHDAVAVPILAQAAALDCAVEELADLKSVVVRYVRR